MSISKRRADILILAGAPARFGWGHLARMKLLCSALWQIGHRCSLQEYPGTPSKADIVILDARDEDFPPWTNSLRRASIDNRGRARREAPAFDALPHPAMVPAEWKRALRHSLLPFPKCAGSDKGRLSVSPERFVFFARRKTQPQYIEWLRKQTVVTSYFGQAMLESLCLGKKVRLHSISRYHAQLARWFVPRYNSLSPKRFYLDGRGAKRLAEKIAELLTSERSLDSSLP